MACSQAGHQYLPIETSKDPVRLGMNYQEVNNAFHKSLETSTRPSTYKTYYESLLVVEDGEKLLVSIGNEDSLDFLNNFHKARIEDIVILTANFSISIL
jgi:hypothetical protein